MRIKLLCTRFFFICYLTWNSFYLCTTTNSHQPKLRAHHTGDYRAVPSAAAAPESIFPVRPAQTSATIATKAAAASERKISAEYLWKCPTGGHRRQHRLRWWSVSAAVRRHQPGPGTVSLQAGGQTAPAQSATAAAAAAPGHRVRRRGWRWWPPEELADQGKCGIYFMDLILQ